MLLLTLDINLNLYQAFLENSLKFNVNGCYLEQNFIELYHFVTRIDDDRCGEM